MFLHLVTFSSMITFSIVLQTSVVNAVTTQPGCQRSIDVTQREFGVIYDYFHGGGDDIVCSYEFRGKEGQRVMIAVSHIGLLPKQPNNKQCKPKITIKDAFSSGDVDTTVICDDNDAKTNGGFVSSSNVAKVTFSGPSDNGILLLQYWFVKDVTLLQTDNKSPQVESTLPSVVERPEPTFITGSQSGSCSERRSDFLRVGIEVHCDSNNLFRSLQCSKWGSDINLDRCVCVDEVTGETNALRKPPYCLNPPESYDTRCLQELAEFRHAITLQETREFFDTYPPVCDTSGNYFKLQCRFIDREACKCVDEITGNITNLAPPLCEIPLTTEAPTELPTSPTVSRGNTAPCFVFFCTTFCESGVYAKDEDGCQICECETPQRYPNSEACPETRSRTIKEMVAQWEDNDPSPPYSWVPGCDSYGFTPQQSNHEAGYFCVDQDTGRPNGKEEPECDTYKACVTDRIIGFSKALRKSGYKKTSREIKRFLTDDMNANDFQQLWDIMSQEERENIFTKSSIFVPSCNDYGDFNALQCNYATGNCWCVDIFGATIDGSRRGITQQMPDCSRYNRRPLELVPVYLNDMYDFTFQLNDSWGVYATFDNYNVSENIYYFWSKDGVPVPLVKEGKFSVNVWPEETQITIGLNVYDSSENDAGSYRCNFVKSSIDYFHSSAPANAEISPDQEFYDYYNYYDNRTECIVMGCNKVCAFGYKYDEICKICECYTRTDILNYEIFEEMKIDIATSFGTKDGRCEAKRQWITKNLKARDLKANRDAIMNFDMPPQCDSNGNFVSVQKISTGRVCVDVMTGEPNGRALPDCRELNKCTKDNILGMESHLKFFLHDQTTIDAAIANITNTGSLRQQFVNYDNALLFSNVTEKIIDGNVSDLLPVNMCHRETGLYYGKVCTYGPSRECWCADLFGNEIKGTRVGVNETEYYCFEPSLEHEPGSVIFLANDTNLYPKVGSTVELPCSVTKPLDDIYIRWSTPRGYFEHVTIVDKRIEMIGDGITDFTLRIANININDEGEYTCELSNDRSRFYESGSYYISVNSY